MGFSEYADSETVSETIHLSSIFADNIHTCKYTIFSAVSHYICFKLTARLSRKKSTADRAIHYPVNKQLSGTEVLDEVSVREYQKATSTGSMAIIRYGLSGVKP